jgi:glycosyltransferase involved in cell wall biosynthesis
MAHRRLKILCVSQMPPSPPRFGAQARIHGLWSALARQNDLTALTLADADFDLAECERALREYCREATVLPNPRGREGTAKRALQLWSLASPRSFEHLRYHAPGLQSALDAALRRQRFDAVLVEFPYLGDLQYRQAPPGDPPPLLVVDSHEIAYDVVRQFARRSVGKARRMYAALDSRKLRREEMAAYRAADLVATCSADDARRIAEQVPSARTVVIPNAADVEHYQPRPSDPASDGQTVMFFGLLSTVPNIDGVTWLVEEIWPHVVAARPAARLRIYGKNPPAQVRALARPAVEVVGFVEDLRPHLAQAAAIVVPLRIGGGTRLKIVEGMAMARAIVSTTLGAEGIEAKPGREILIADEPAAFAQALVRLLDRPALAAEMGRAARRLAVEKYAWSAAAEALQRACLESIAARAGAPAGLDSARQPARFD